MSCWFAARHTLVYAPGITVTVHSIWKVENLVDRPGRAAVECTVTVIPLDDDMPGG
jgi:hypothetical protein